MKILIHIFQLVVLLAAFALAFFAGWKCHEHYVNEVSEIGQRLIKKKIDERKPEIHVSPFPPHVYPRRGR